MMEPRTDAPLQTTQTSMDVVGLVNEREGATLREIADELGLARSTAHSHLQTLRENGLLTKEGSVYHLGMRLFHLGSRARHRREEYKMAGDVVRKLAETTGEEADFYVEERGRCVALYDTIASSERTSYPIGEYFHMHYSAIGKAILAEWPDRRVEAVIDRWGLPRASENTITSRSRLYEELETIREQGYSINDEEVDKGLRAVGAAVEQADGSVLGGFSIVGPTYRLDHDRLHGEFSELLLETIDEMESRIEALSRPAGSSSGRR